MIIDGTHLLTEKEVSTKFEITVHWLRYARYTNSTMPYYRLNNKVYYKAEEVSKWLSERLKRC